VYGLLLVVVSVALVAFNAHSVNRQADIDEISYRQQAAKMVVLNLGPSVVPNNVQFHFDPYVGMSAGVYREWVNRYGHIAGTRPAHPDRAIVSLTDIKPVPVNDAVGNCTPLRGPSEVPRRIDSREGVNPMTRVVLHASSSDATVQIRRFENSWVPVGRIAAGTTAALDLPILIAQAPWMLLADGACEVQG